MGVEDESAAVSSSFVAQPGMVGIGPKWSPKRAYMQMYGFVAVLIFGIVVIPLVLNSSSPESRTRSVVELAAAFGFLVIILVGLGAYYRWHSRQTILIEVTGDGLRVSKRRGSVFAFGDMTVGPWGWGAGTMGTALHCRCGRDSFVLGGRDSRVGSGTRLAEAPVPGVDAWVGAAEFDQLLSSVGRHGGPDVRPPAPGEPIRCVLSPNPQRAQAASPSEVRKQHRLMQSASSLAIEVGTDSLQVIDPNTNTLIASASTTQVTATPVTYQYPYNHWYPSPNNVLADAEMKYLSTAPELILRLPGMQQPLTIACLDIVGALGITRRFSWRSDAAVADEPADYAVSGADWLTLVDRFGLAPYQETSLTELSSPTPTPSAGYLHDQAISRVRRRGGWGTIVAASVVSVIIIVAGGYPLWIQHFGVPDRITVQYCDKDHGSIIDLLLNGDYRCSGKSHQDRQVELWGMYRNNVGQDIDVHITPGAKDNADAVPDALIMPLILVVVGGVFGFGTFIAVVRRLRRSPP